MFTKLNICDQSATASLFQPFPWISYYSFSHKLGKKDRSVLVNNSRVSLLYDLKL